MSGYRGLDNAPPAELGAVAAFQHRIREVVNNLLQGKANVTRDVTLAAGAASTTVDDPRIGGASAILLACPLTANAAAELGAGTIYLAAIGKQTAILAHASNAQTDRTFRLVIMG
jgi:hypothetical protein